MEHNSALLHGLISRGYVKDPNSATRWYAGGPGIPEAIDADVHVKDGYIELLPKPWRTSGKVALGTFATVEGLFDWLKAHGKTSEPGFRQPYWID